MVPGIDDIARTVTEHAVQGAAFGGVRLEYWAMVGSLMPIGASASISRQDA